MNTLEMVAAAKQVITEVSPSDANAQLSVCAILDVREPAEFAAGKIPGAINIPRGLLEFKLGDIPSTPANGKLLVYCQSGGRSALATETLQKLGIANAVSLAGGFKAWSEQGLPVQ